MMLAASMTRAGARLCVDVVPFGRARVRARVRRSARGELAAALKISVCLY